MAFAFQVMFGRNFGDLNTDNLELLIGVRRYWEIWGDYNVLQNPKKPCTCLYRCHPFPHCLCPCRAPWIKSYQYFIINCVFTIGVIEWDGKGWIKVNLGHKGFFITNYEEKNWKALALQLKKQHTVRLKVITSVRCYIRYLKSLVCVPDCLVMPILLIRYQRSNWLKVVNRLLLSIFLIRYLPLSICMSPLIVLDGYKGKSDYKKPLNIHPSI